MAPGLRVAYVLTPDRAAASVLSNALRTVSQMPVPLMVALVSRWLADGSADAIISAVATEAAARQKLAAKALSGQSYAAHPKGHHVWLRLPPHGPARSLPRMFNDRGLRWLRATVSA